VSADQEKTWATLTDVPLLVSWLSVLEQAEELAPLAHYSAVLMDRLGPFKLRADLDIVLSEVVDGRHVAVRAEGEDRQVGSRVVVDAVLDLEPGAAGGSVVRVAGTYEVTGRVASMGSGTIRKKADKILDEFFVHLAEALGDA
jgi:carbon monoxide dehydrogenase subunit G